MRDQQDPRFVSRLTKDTLALVLAGGRGTRLNALTDWRAKPAVPFGGKFRIIDFPLSNCINSGVRRIAVLTQYKSHSLIRHIQMGWGFLRGEFNEFVELFPAQQRVDETSWYAGTADAVFQNIDILLSHAPSYLLVLAGDHIYKMDYGQMLAEHVRRGAEFTVGCIEVPLAEASAFGVMQVDAEMRIRQFAEKPAAPEPMPGRDDVALASMGIYVFNTRFLIDQLVRDAADKASSHDFGKDIIPKAIHEFPAYAYAFREPDGEHQGYWRDVGTVEAFWKANLELLDPLPQLNLYDADWPIWTYQEQLPPAKFAAQEGRAGCALDSMVSGGCLVVGATVRRSVLFSNVRVEMDTEIDESVLLPNVTVGRGCRIRRAVLDKGCTIPDGTYIGIDPVHDAERFHVISNGVVLVTRDMLGQSRYVPLSAQRR
ncbi:MAG: glucose-1-phosphate adenylyltransferase [Lysobacterales bacterium]|nr:glucose-1-phosphate adenylyltransferase [Xanthomonadales bacterium]